MNVGTKVEVTTPIRVLGPRGYYTAASPEDRGVITKVSVGYVEVEFSTGKIWAERRHLKEV